MKYLLILFLIVFASCGRQFHFSPTSTVPSDTSFVYTLPYPPGKTKLLVQGYNSQFSHRGRLGYDFKMKTGSPVTATRDGIVVALREDHTKGGVNRKYYGQANSVTVRHADGTQAFYGHLKYDGVVVSVGDSVHTGQLLAYSGSTGYSAFPHLHFMVWWPAAVGRKQVPVRFHTRKGTMYLRPGHWYKAV